jgi:type IV pilus assembly protein PilM
MELQKILFKFFPPPEFLQTRSAGLSISEDAVRVIEFDEHKGQPFLSHFGEQELPEGVIKDGEIQKPEELQKILRAFRKKHELNFVRASISERKAYIVKMEIPRVENSEIRSVIETHLEEYVPVSVAEAIFDYQILKEANTPKDSLNLEVSVIDEKVAESYLQVFEETGLTITSFENEAQAVARAVIPEEEKDTCMVVDFGGSRTGIYIIVNGSVDFTTSIDMGGSSLNQLFKDKFSVEKNEARKIINEFDCNAFLENEENEKTAVLMSFISAFRDEIRKHFFYWQTHKDASSQEGEIQRIILTGSESVLKGLPQYMAGGLNAPVELADVWGNVFDFNEYIPDVSHRDSFRYGGAIGLAIPSIEDSLRVVKGNKKR